MLYIVTEWCLNPVFVAQENLQCLGFLTEWKIFGHWWGKCFEMFYEGRKNDNRAKCPSPPHLKGKGGSPSLIRVVILYKCGRGVMTGLFEHLCSAFRCIPAPGCHGEPPCLSQQRSVVATADHKCSAMPAFLYLGIWLIKDACFTGKLEKGYLKE